MTMSDPLGDMLTRIRNAQRTQKSVVVAPASQLRANVLEVLKREGTSGIFRGATRVCPSCGSSSSIMTALR
jgi:small subunit ribosomal protein S8